MAHTLKDYLALLDDLAAAGYRFHPICDYFAARVQPPFVYLRHDVDRVPGRAVTMASGEAVRGIRATYYFRCTRAGVFPTDAMRTVAAFGHEVGFHYESLSRAHGDTGTAVALFERELASARAIAPIATVAPHGAPLSAVSNMDFTAGLAAARFGLLGDATDIDFREILYITDTGGGFGSRYNLRDRPNGRGLDRPTPPRRLARDLIDAGERRVVLSCHPERWPESYIGLLQASARDWVTNAVKMVLARVRRGSKVLL